MDNEQLYRNTRSWPEWWRRMKFGDAVIDAEKDAEAQEDRARRLKGWNARLNEENRNLREELERLRQQL